MKTYALGVWYQRRRIPKTSDDIIHIPDPRIECAFNRNCTNTFPHFNALEVSMQCYPNSICPEVVVYDVLQCPIILVICLVCNTQPKALVNKSAGLTTPEI